MQRLSRLLSGVESCCNAHAHTTQHTTPHHLNGARVRRLDYCKEHATGDKDADGDHIMHTKETDPIFLGVTPGANGLARDMKGSALWTSPAGTHAQRAAPAVPRVNVTKEIKAAGNERAALEACMAELTALKEAKAAETKRADDAEDTCEALHNSTVPKLSHTWLRVVSKETGKLLRWQLTNLPAEGINKLLNALDECNFGGAYGAATKSKVLSWEDAVILTLVKHKTFDPHERLGYASPPAGIALRRVWSRGFINCIIVCGDAHMT